MLVVPFAVGVPAGTADRGPPDTPTPPTADLVVSANLAPGPLASSLDPAERLLAAGAGSRPLATGLAQAQSASGWQADRLDPERGLADAPAPDHDRPSEAAFALLDRHDVSPSEAERADVRALDELPADVAGALADLVDAFLGVEEATELAYADADPDALAALAARADRALSAQAWQDPTARAAPSEGAPGERLATAGVHLGPALAARNAFLDAVARLDRALEAHPALAAGSGPVVHQPPAIAVDLAGGDDTYEEDTALMVDVGGEDAYHNNAGGSSLTNLPEDGLDRNPCDFPATEVVEHPPPGYHGAAALVDLGEGDDVHGRPGTHASCGRNGGGHVGLGLLVDEGGDDLYRAGTDVVVRSPCEGLECEAGSVAINGGGSLGAGLLVDAAGNDTYVAGSDARIASCAEGDCGVGSVGVNGGADAGAGMLVDVGGDDLYRVGDNVTSFCSAGGCVSGGGGVNGGANLGVATLVDSGGDDVYRAGTNIDVASCETGGCGVVGVGVNGGTNLGQALFVEGGGNDVYRAGTNSTITSCDGGRCGLGSSGSNGGTNPGGRAQLVDAGGDDVYRAGTNATVVSCPADCRVGSFGVNGGSAIGTAVLADLSGDDAYLAGTDAEIQSCSEGSCPVGSDGVNGGSAVGLALLFDGGGTDRYDDDMGGSGTDRTVVPKGFLGAQVDAGTPSP